VRRLGPPVEPTRQRGVDPAMRHVVGGRAAQADKDAASPSGVGRFETEMLSQRHNLTALMNLSGQWIDKAHLRQPLRELILDMDKSNGIGFRKSSGRYGIRTEWRNRFALKALREFDTIGWC